MITISHIDAGSRALLHRIRAHLRSLAISLLGLAILSGCSVPEIPGIHRLDIQQGNVVTQDMLARLEPGMTKRRVRFVLGTPLIADAFRSDRWDYIYTFKTGTDRPIQRTISVFFADDRLARLEGDIQASIGVASAAPERTDQIVKVTGPRKSEGLFDVINPFDSRRVTPKAKPEDASPSVDKQSAEEQEQPTTETTAAVAPEAQTATNDEARAQPSPNETKPAESGSWWDRVTGSDTEQPKAPEDGAASGADKTADVAPTSNSDSMATPKVTPKAAVAAENPDSPTAQDSPTQPSESVATSDQAAEPVEGQPKVQDREQADGGFFARIRQRFKLPEVPSGLIKPPSEAPVDEPGDG
jgi:outer membrane protein assembly factor BamE